MNWLSVWISSYISTLWMYYKSICKVLKSGAVCHVGLCTAFCRRFSFLLPPIIIHLWIDGPPVLALAMLPFLFSLLCCGVDSLLCMEHSAFKWHYLKWSITYSNLKFDITHTTILKWNFQCLCCHCYGSVEYL